MTGRQTDIDREYGLEPVFEPGDAGAGSDSIEPFVGLQCPWCAEPIELRLDLSGGDQSYIEDCQVCCRPIQVSVQVAADGSLQQLLADRTEG
jgi:hypothetical protein